MKVKFGRITVMMQITVKVNVNKTLCWKLQSSFFSLINNMGTAGEETMIQTRFECKVDVGVKAVGWEFFDSFIW